MGHGWYVLHFVAVVRSTDLHENVPGLTKSWPSQGTAIKGLDVVQLVQVQVLEGIAIAIPFEVAMAGNMDDFCSGEEFVIGDVLVSSAPASLQLAG